ncbi:hypothetical protein DV736_g5451, partial [Chaetothyriales sp. CBS 134916]
MTMITRLLHETPEAETVCTGTNKGGTTCTRLCKFWVIDHIALAARYSDIPTPRRASKRSKNIGIHTDVNLSTAIHSVTLSFPFYQINHLAPTSPIFELHLAAFDVNIQPVVLGAGAFLGVAALGLTQMGFSAQDRQYKKTLQYMHDAQDKIAKKMKDADTLQPSTKK